MNNFQITLRAARINKCYSIEQAAKLLNVTPTTLANWENGVTYPRVNVLPKIEEVYGVEYNNIKFFSKKHD